MQKGFSLIEVLVAIAITVSVLGALTYLIKYIYVSQSLQIDNLSYLSKTRQGITQITSLIRRADYSDIGDYPITRFATSSFEFFANFDKDANIEKIKLYLQNGDLKMAIYNPSGFPVSYPNQPDYIHTPIKNIVNANNEPIFSYFDEYNNSITNIQDLLKIKRVKIHIKTKKEKLNDTDIFELYSNATLRNNR